MRRAGARAGRWTLTGEMIQLRRRVEENNQRAGRGKIMILARRGERGKKWKAKWEETKAVCV